MIYHAYHVVVGIVWVIVSYYVFWKISIFDKIYERFESYFRYLLFKNKFGYLKCTKEKLQIGKYIFFIRLVSFVAAYLILVYLIPISAPDNPVSIV